MSFRGFAGALRLAFQSLRALDSVLLQSKRLICDNLHVHVSHVCMLAFNISACARGQLKDLENSKYDEQKLKKDRDDGVVHFASIMFFNTGILG